VISVTAPMIVTPLIVLISRFFYGLDIVTDIIVTIQFFESDSDDAATLGIISLCIICAPLFAGSILLVPSVAQRARFGNEVTGGDVALSMGTFCLWLIFGPIVLLCCQLSLFIPGLYLWRRPSKDKSPFMYHYLRAAVLYESMLESFPQIVLQTYVIFSDSSSSSSISLELYLISIGAAITSLARRVYTVRKLAKTLNITVRSAIYLTITGGGGSRAASAILQGQLIVEIDDNDAVFTMIGEALCSPDCKCRYLNLKHRLNEDEELAIIRGLCSNTTVETVIFSEMFMTQAKADAIADMLRNNSSIRTVFYEMPVSHEEYQFLPEIADALLERSSQTNRKTTFYCDCGAKHPIVTEVLEACGDGFVCLDYKMQERLVQNLRRSIRH
jgi:XK-related protein